MRCLAGLVTMAAVVALVAGCGDESTEADDPAPECPSYADVSDGPGADGVYSDFIVGLADGTDLAASLDEVGERLCLRLAPGRELATGSVLITSDRPLDAAGQALLIAALQKVDGVEYAEPDAVVTLDGSGDVQGAE